MLEKEVIHRMQDPRRQEAFDPLNNIEWSIEIAWGQKYISQFDVLNTSVEDLSDLLWLGIIKRRLWFLEADIVIKKWNDRHPKAMIPTPILDETRKTSI